MAGVAFIRLYIFNFEHESLQQHNSSDAIKIDNVYVEPFWFSSPRNC